jgi:protein MpaA
MFMHYRFILLATVISVSSLALSGCTECPPPAIVDYGQPIYTAPVAPVPAPKPAAPATRIITLGRSVQGAAIKMYVFGTGSPTILIFGGIHGNEYTSAYVARNLVFVLSKDTSLYEGKTVAVIPSVNPDGLVANTRTNTNGIDVNRNFPASNWQFTKRGDSFGGTRPASEPETRAIIKAVTELDPACIVSIHSTGNGKHGNNYDGPAADLAHILSDNNGYRVLVSMGYPTPGSFGTWAGIDRKIPTLTLELPRDASSSVAWRQNRAALLALIQHY